MKDGIVSFNQTLKLYVNMYYDTTTSKFVEKKVNFKDKFSACTVSWSVLKKEKNLLEILLMIFPNSSTKESMVLANLY